MKKTFLFFPLLSILMPACQEKEEIPQASCSLLSEQICEMPGGTALQPAYTLEDIDYNPANPHQILYVGYRSSVNVYELRRLDLTHCTDERIFSDSNPITDIDWASTGDILYSNNGLIFSMSGNGENIRVEDFFFTVVSPTDPFPQKAVWSPDGKRLACYISTDEGIYVHIKKKGEGEVQEIGPLPMGWMGDFSWYTQGLGLYYSAIPDERVTLLVPETGNLQSIGPYTEMPQHAVYDASAARLLWTPTFPLGGPRQLYTLNLTTGISTTLGTPCDSLLFSKVKISPNGKQVATICRYQTTVNNTVQVKESIVLMNPDGSKPLTVKNPL